VLFKNEIALFWEINTKHKKNLRACRQFYYIKAGGTYKITVYSAESQTDVSEEHVASIRSRFACYLVLFSCVAYYLTLKMEATLSSKTSVDFQRTTRHCIPEERTLQFFPPIIFSFVQISVPSSV
jgi:hypothetical protein